MNIDLNVDKYASLAAAFDAGKLPSTAQMNGSIDRLLRGPLIQAEQSSSEGQLSEHGRAIATSVRGILEAYKQLGANKNGDDQLQEALWNLSQGELTTNIKSTISAPTPSSDGEATSDAQSLSNALRTLISVFLANVFSESSSLFGDFASFSRVIAADAAEKLEHRARDAKTGLRDVEGEVQDGKRDTLGRVKKDDEEVERGKDPQVQFERGMDTVKGLGSNAIGTTQGVKETASGMTGDAKQKLTRAAENILNRSRTDEQYHQAVSTIFNLAHKYLSKSIDVAADSAQNSSLDGLINDPTGRVPAAIHSLIVLAERLGGNQSLNPLFDALRQCGADIREDEELRRFFDDYLNYTKRVLDEVEYSDSTQREKDAGDLERRWDAISGEDTERRRVWREHVGVLRREWEAYQVRVKEDADVVRLKEAHLRLVNDFAPLAELAGKTAVGDTAWIWQDVLNVYLPRVLEIVKDIPLPRTEFTSPEVDFVIEDMDISSLKLFPGHAHISNTSDIDISQSAPGSTTSTSLATKTTVNFKAVQLTLKEVSFYYHDKKRTSSVGPSEFTGLLDITLPEKGLDVSVGLSLIPTAPTSSTRDPHRERQRQGGFHKIEHVSVSLASDVEINVRKSNHPVLLSTFKPLVRTRVRKALETTLEEQVRVLVEFADQTAWDTHKRAKVFLDGGAPVGAAYLGGVWSELGKLKGMPGPFSGWGVGGKGVVKDDERTDTAFAMGTAPQLISGDKHGPRGNFSDERKAQLEGTTVADTGDLKGVAKAGAEKARSYKALVDQKLVEESKREGWRSPAFDAFA